jgi:hypothetical protein
MGTFFLHPGLGDMDITIASRTSAMHDRILAAIELAWEAVCWEVQGLLPTDRENMERAIINAVALGERDFILLQRRALAASPSTTAMPLERRRNVPLTRFDGDRRRR